MRIEIHSASGPKRVVMSGTTLLSDNEALHVTADDGTELRFKWDEQGPFGGGGPMGDLNMKVLEGHFDRSELSEAGTSYFWGCGEEGSNKTVEVKAFARRVAGGLARLDYTVTANF